MGPKDFTGWMNITASTAIVVPKTLSIQEQPAANKGFSMTEH